MKILFVMLSLFSVVQKAEACSCSGNTCTINSKSTMDLAACPDSKIIDGTEYRTCNVSTNNKSNPNETVPVSCAVTDVNSTGTSKTAKQGGSGATTEKDLGRDNKNGYGGAYNTTNASTTGALNDAVKLTNSGLQQLGSTMTNNAGATAQSNLLTTGTAQSAAQGTADTLNAAAKTQTMYGFAAATEAALQMQRANAHRNSAATLTDNSTKVSTANGFAAFGRNSDGSFLIGCSAESFTTAGINALCSQAINKAKGIIATNAAAERSKQTETAYSEAITAAGTTMAATTAFQQAAADRNQAKIALAAAGSGFAFNPGGTTGYTDTGTSAAATPDPGSVLDSTAANSPLDSSNQINPNVDPGTGNVPTGNLSAAAPGGAAGGAGGGLGSASGTSAGKDDTANKDNTPPGKSSAGSYADPAGASGFVRNTAGPAVGVDGSFADMLKKFLPGDDEKKKDGDLNFNDRTPASDAAAVIARNKNIFEEVSKRYKKKSTEGAIVF